MKLIHKRMSHIITFEGGYVSELAVENRKMFYDMVNNIITQIEGLHGDFTLSINNRPVEFSKYADVTLQFAPFLLNRKSLLNKLCSLLEQRAANPDFYIETAKLLGTIESYFHGVAEDLPFEIDCGKIAIGPIIKALSPQISEDDKTGIEKIFSYMELVRELDKERLFIMINMRSYFSDSDMNCFIQSATLHDFKVLLLESASYTKLNNVKRYIIDEDLCEF
ncbi:MAG: type II-A CRISPR-associated protein Csn2 [Clostridia bacterium]|nr:type II-A CRISPR-associated protein Csn2 [Clostridia bacterium]